MVTNSKSMSFTTDVGSLVPCKECGVSVPPGEGPPYRSHLPSCPKLIQDKKSRQEKALRRDYE